MVTDKISAITLDLTENCNLRCTYCFTSGKTNREISLKTAKDTVDWLVKPETCGNAKSVNIAFWGGEPLLKLDLIKELVEYGKEVTNKTGIKVTWGMTTNLTLCTPEVSQWLKDNKIFPLFSVDGTRDNHNKYRPLANGQGSYDLVEKGIDNLLAIDMPMCLRFTLAPDTIKDLYNDIKWYMENKGVYSFHFSPAFELNWDEAAVNEMDHQFQLIVDEISAQLDRGKLLRVRPFAYGVTNLLNADPKLERNACGAGCNYVGVSVDGAIYPCHRFHDFCDRRPWQEQEKCIGSIYDGITRPEFRANFLNYRENLKKGNYKCLDCELYRDKLCFGGCTAANTDNTGDMYLAPEIECIVEKLQVKYAKVLLSRHKNNRQFLGRYYERHGNNKKCKCNYSYYNQDACECYLGCYNDSFPNVLKNRREEEEKAQKILKEAQEIIKSGDQVPNDIVEFAIETALRRR